jgi:hypothetical protein
LNLGSACLPSVLAGAFHTSVPDIDGAIERAMPQCEVSNFRVGT